MPAADSTRVAVIGAGIGGASFVSFLEDEIARRGGGRATIAIDVFERADRIGGRTLATPDGANAVELGASMAINQNRYVADFADALGLARRPSTERPGRGGGRLAILTGAGGAAPFFESEWKAVTLAKMLYRFGPLDFFQLRAVGKAFIANFTKIYDAQDGGRAFATPQALLAHAGLESFTRRSCAGALADVLGYSDNGGADAAARAPVAAELVSALTRNNYNQDFERMGALCCFTAVAPLAAGGSAAAWSVPGGNAQIARGLLERSTARVHLRSPVRAIRPAPAGDDGGGFLVQFNASQEARYDVVVLAAPLAGSGIDVLDVLADSARAGAVADEQTAAFQPVYVTLVWGALDPAYFNASTADGGPGAALNTAFGDILTTANTELPFFSIGRYGDRRARWKFFSYRELSDEDLAPIFVDFVGGDAVVRHAWRAPGAYPVSRPLDDGDGMAPFVLASSRTGGGLVLYPSALERATSAMEVLAVAARNAALLVADAVAGPRTTRGGDVDDARSEL